MMPEFTIQQSLEDGIYCCNIQHTAPDGSTDLFITITGGGTATRPYGQWYIIDHLLNRYAAYGNEPYAYMKVLKALSYATEDLDAIARIMGTRWHPLPIVLDPKAKAKVPSRYRSSDP